MKRTFTKVLCALLAMLALIALLPAAQISVLAAETESVTEEIEPVIDETTSAEGAAEETDVTVQLKETPDTSVDNGNNVPAVEPEAETNIPEETTNEAAVQEPGTPLAATPSFLGGPVPFGNLITVTYQCSVCGATYTATVVADTDFSLPASNLIRSCNCSLNGDLVFDGWQKNGETDVMQPGQATQLSNDDTIQAIWRRADITVTYQNNQGQAASVAVPGDGSFTVSGISNVAEQGHNWARPHYTFAGWSDGTTLVYTPGQAVSGPFTGNITLTALYAANVVYHQSSEGTGTFFEERIDTSTLYPTLPVGWEKENADFLGWAVSFDETDPGNIKAPGSTFAESSRGGPVHLYPVFKSHPVIRYTVGAQGSLDNIPSQVHCAGNTVYTVVADIPTFPLHNFAGWQLSGAENTVYQAGESFVMPNHDVTLVALWNYLGENDTTAGNDADSNNSDTAHLDNSSAGNDKGTLVPYQPGNTISPVVAPAAAPQKNINLAGNEELDLANPVGNGQPLEATNALDNTYTPQAQNVQAGGQTAPIVQEQTMQVSMQNGGLPAEGNHKTLLNIILTVLSLLLCIAMALSYTTHHNKIEEDALEDMEAHKDRILQMLGIPLFLAAMLMFLFTQSFTGSWILADKWTIPLAIFPFSQMVVNFVATSKNKVVEADEA